MGSSGTYDPSTTGPHGSSVGDVRGGDPHDDSWHEESTKWGTTEGASHSKLDPFEGTAINTLSAVEGTSNFTNVDISNDLDVGGDITVGGTVDGRDVAADGSTLDQAVIDINAAEGDISTLQGEMTTVEAKLARLAQQTLSIASGAVDWNMANGHTADVTLTENVTAVNEPSNIVNGMDYYLYIRQDNTGSWTVGGWNAVFDFGDDGAPTITATADEGDLIHFVGVNNKLVCQGVKTGFTA